MQRGSRWIECWRDLREILFKNDTVDLRELPRTNDGNCYRAKEELSDSGVVEQGENDNSSKTMFMYEG